jgi:tetratricopeptide (TPR) repeat protein
MVLLSGEPGIGKSRLTVELAASLEAEPHQIVRYFCAPHYVDSAFRPIAIQFERVAGIWDGDPGPVKRRKFAATLSRSTSPEDKWLLSDLLSLGGDDAEAFAQVTPQQKKQKTLEAILHQLEQLSRERPVLLVVEDLHWMDPSTRELLDLTVERITVLPVLLVATARPGFKAHWTGQPNVTTLALNPLDRRDGVAMIESVAGGRTLPPEVLTQLIDRADGVPLYVEELTRSVLESGFLSDRGDRYVLAAPLPPRAIPTSLQASLMARLDRLSSVKEIAQAAAAIGREFSYALIAAASERSEPQLREALDRLVEAGLIFQRGVPPAAIFTFKHALLQDAAYGSMVTSQRQQLHRRVALAIEERFPRVADVEPETLARHYAEAGQGDRAIEHWQKAGHRAAQRLAWREASAHFRKAVRLTLEMPESTDRKRRELALVLPLGHALFGSAGGALETEAAYARARELARDLGDQDAFCRAVMGLANVFGLTARIGDSLALGTDAIAFGESGASPLTGLVARRVLGSAQWHRGELLESERHFRAALVAARQLGAGLEGAGGFTSDPVITLPVNAAIPLWALGHVDEALALEAASLSMAARADANIQGFALAWAIFVDLLRRDGAASMQHATELLRLVEDKGAKYFAGFAAWGRGAALAISGSPAAGLEQMQAGARRFLGTGGRLYEPFLWMGMAEAHRLLNHLDNAFDCLERARQCVDNPDQRFYEPEMHRLFGVFFQQRGESARAAASYLRAVATARSQAARSWELRAATDLARLWRDEGKAAPARDLLEPACASFAGTLDAPELKAARAILASLG